MFGLVGTSLAGLAGAETGVFSPPEPRVCILALPSIWAVLSAAAKPLPASRWT